MVLERNLEVAHAFQESGLEIAVLGGATIAWQVAFGRGKRMRDDYLKRQTESEVLLR